MLNLSIQELSGNNVEGVLALRNPWPSIARSVFGDHQRYLDTYMRPYPGVFYTGDGAARDEHGYIWIKGRVDGERSVALAFTSVPTSHPHHRCHQCLRPSPINGGN